MHTNMIPLSQRRLWIALRALGAILVFGLANKLRSQEAVPEIRKATVVEDAPAAPPVSDEKAVPHDGPVEIPQLSKYAKLWTESLFTTRALPAPEAPKGPTFADNLSLSGTYEMNGKMVAILIDKTTSGVMEAFIGEDNDAGIRISKIEPSIDPDKIKIQLQKGAEVGWVSFADLNATGDQMMARPEGNGAPPASAPGAVPAIPSPVPVPMPVQQPQQPPVQTAPVMPPQSQAPMQPQPAPGTFNINAGMPQAAPQMPNDVPLPPP